jgi:hypothetical protein
MNVVLYIFDIPRYLHCDVLWYINHDDAHKLNLRRRVASFTFLPRKGLSFCCILGFTFSPSVAAPLFKMYIKTLTIQGFKSCELRWYSECAKR